jgi:2-amino-4-hydroxy-6-hydroxymethyldihydropteridine diphosphokinase
VELTKVFIGLGGNLGDSCAVLRNALKLLGDLPMVFSLHVSPFYLTTPVSDLSQNHYINAVCQFETFLTPSELFRRTQEIERTLGKIPKEKNAPRRIDLDILFYGQSIYQDNDLLIPHVKWSERLFVIKPLSDLTSEITLLDPQTSGILQFNLMELLKSFPNIHKETVVLLQKTSFVDNNFDKDV